MRILPYTEIDEYDKKIKTIRGELISAETRSGCVVESSIENGKFSFLNEVDIEDMKMLMVFLVTCLRLEYKGN